MIYLTIKKIHEEQFKDQNFKHKGMSIDIITHNIIGINQNSHHLHLIQILKISPILF